MLRWKKRKRKWTRFTHAGPSWRKREIELPRRRATKTSLPLRVVQFQPPASGISLLREDRPAACLGNGSDEVIFNLVSLERSGQELIDLDDVICRASRNAKSQNGPISHVQQSHQDRHYQGCPDYSPSPVYLHARRSACVLVVRR